MHMQKRQVWVARWKICSTVFERYWKTLTERFLDVIGVICIILSISNSYLGMVEGDRNNMAASFVAWTILVLSLILQNARTSGTSASPSSVTTQQNQYPCFLRVVAAPCFAATGIESYLGMVTGSSTHMTVCFCSWLILVLIAAIGVHQEPVAQ
jgi:hypothetical protein